MAAPKNVNKMDLSLDDIIKLNKRQAKDAGGKGKGRVRGRGRGRGKPGQVNNIPGPGRQNTGRGGGQGAATPGGLRRRGRGRGKALKTATVGASAAAGSGSGTAAQQKVQRLRQKAKKLLRSKKKQAPQPAQESSKPVTGVKLRLGPRVGTGVAQGSVRGKGKGRMQRSANTRQQQTTSGLQEAAASRPGGRLKALRALKAQKTGTRGRGRGLQTDALKQALQGRPGNRGRGTSVRGRGTSARGRGIGGGGQKPAASTGPIAPTPITTAAQGGRGRGRRGRGGRVGGAVAGRLGGVVVERERQSEVEVSFEPIGVDIPLVLCAEQHTSKSLHNRFTPKADRKPLQRMVYQGGRTVNLQS